ncbi:MAG: phospholipase D-like domain-containing protein [Gammaproteobacteria bacterium]
MDSGSGQIVVTTRYGRKTLYTEGDALYAAMLEAIAAAQHSVKLESYIFANDDVGRRFAAGLSARARAGVRVLVNIDAAGSLFWGSHRMEKGMQCAGVQVHWFHRWSWRDPARYNRRNHRKLLVVDAQRGFLGGFNIHRENSRAAYGAERWRDTHLEIDGQLARNLDVLFDAFWTRRRRNFSVLRSRQGNLITNHSRYGRLLLRDLYAARFTAARERVWLTTPYFVPDSRTQRALRSAARRGVDVRVLVPHKNDVRVVQWAARAAYAGLLQAGIRIYEYLPRVLHAKTVVVDGIWSSVGTANIDYRSFFLNYELTFTLRDADFATVLERQFRADLEAAVQIQPSLWAKRALWRRMLEFIGWLARRWL